MAATTKAHGRAVPDAVAERAATRYAINEAGCWITTYAIQPTGYAYIAWQAEARKTAAVPVHRAAFQHHHGHPPRAGGQVDHTCHDPEVCQLRGQCPHRACVNPDHLCDGTVRQNTARSSCPVGQNIRKTECPRCGAPYTHEGKGRRCKPCHAAKQRERWARQYQGEWRERYIERQRERLCSRRSPL